MKSIINSGITFILALLLIQCGQGNDAGSAGSLEEKLVDHTFTMQGLEDASASISASCSSGNNGSSSSAADINTLPNTSPKKSNPTETYEAEADLSVGLLKSVSQYGVSQSAQQTIRFDQDSYTLWENGQPVQEGSWEAIDGNTIKVSSSGSSYYFDVSISDGVMKVSASKENKSGCGGGIAVPDSSPMGSESVDGLGEEFNGTWCYSSGVPLLLVLAQYDGALYEADLILNRTYSKNNVTSNYVYAAQTDWDFIDGSRFDGGVKLGLYWEFATPHSSRYQERPTVSFASADKMSLKVRYGLGREAIFKKSPSVAEGQCGVVTVAKPDFDLLLSDFGVSSENELFNLLNQQNVNADYGSPDMNFEGTVVSEPSSGTGVSD